MMRRSILHQLHSGFNNAIAKAFPDIDHSKFPAAVTPSKNATNGDYQCNNAMSLFKALKSQFSNPREVATAITGALEGSELVESLSVAGPGFINIKLNMRYVAEQVRHIVENGGMAPPELPKKRTIVDFSSPNIAKEMHVGHLRSTIIGETISRLFEFVGYEVERVNHVGDWGTQFGMLIAYLKEEFPDFLTNPPNISNLQTFYKASKVVFDENPEFKKKAHEEVVKLQSGNEDNLAAWHLLCDISRKEFQKIYDRLDIKLTEVGESFYNPIIPKVLGELSDLGLVTESDGAQCIFVEGFSHPLIVRKRDGGFTYDSTDMAAIWHRIFERTADRMIYVVDSGQASHFDLIFAAAKMAGWLKEPTEATHVGFGVVLGEDKKKFKTRSGDTVKLVDLLDEAVERTYNTITERERAADEGAEDEATEELEDKKDRLSEEEKRHAAEVIGYAAIKYADLKSNRLSNYIFSFDRMLDLKGNTAVYLLYAHARIASIVRKAGVSIESQMSTSIELEHEAEKQLGLTLLKFSEVIELTVEDLMPNRICEYVYELSTKFNEFFRDCRVIGNEKQAQRLILCEATALVMRQCFSLLGMQYLMKI